MSGIRRVAIVQRDVNREGSLERDAAVLVRELAARGIETHVYCDARTFDSSLSDAVVHDVRAHGTSRAALIASFAASATRAVRLDRHRVGFDVVAVNGFAGWEHDVVRVHEVIRAAQQRWPRECESCRRFPTIRAAMAPLSNPVVGVDRVIQALQLRPHRFSGLVAVAPQVARDLQDLGIPAELIELIPPPVVLAADGPDPRRALGLGPDERLLLFVGHAFQRKGLEEALGALAGLPRGAHLVVVGDPGPDVRAKATDRARQLGVASRVHLVGADEPGAYFRAADVFLLPTHHDTWGMTIVEAMAAGVPVVTTAAAGAAALVSASGAGIVVERADARAVRDAVASLLDDPARRARMGTAGREAAAPYTPRGSAARMLAAYERFRDRATVRVVSVPHVQRMNPYQRLLYAHLRDEHVELDGDGELTLRWLRRARGRVRLLHLHWPESSYTLQRGPRGLRPAGSWLKLGLFAVRLTAARALGYRIVWTIHQPLPHRTGHLLLHRLGGRVLASQATVLIAHDEATRNRVAAVLGDRVARRVAIVPHGSYVGVYPAGRSRELVRDELGIPRDAFVFLSLGELRPDKSWRLVLDAFAATPGADLALVIAGAAHADVRAAVLERAARDERVRLELGFVEEARVAELFGAADAAVVARDDGGTSGSLILPLSLGVPVVAADRPAYRAVTDGERAAWLYRPGDVASLRRALERAARGGEASERAVTARSLAESRDWDEIAAETARLVRA